MKTTFILCFFTVPWIILSGCNKSAAFYQHLRNTPELYQEPGYAYLPSYNVGDTMIIYGRLNPGNDLTIKIGDALAPIAGTATVDVSVSNAQGSGVPAYPIDQVKVLITAGMGLGDNRPVTITSAGNAIQGPPIGIYSPVSEGYPTDSLKLAPYFPFPIGANFLNCVNGKGAVYYFYNLSITQVKKGGISSTIMTTADTKDAYGPFSIVTFYSGAVDPQEQNLYFSALTSDTSADNAVSSIYRLCRYNLATRQLITLNRTLVPKDQRQVTSATYQPFEGSTGMVKITRVNAIYPGSSGDLYLRLSTYAICHVSTAGSVKYLVKASPNTGVYPVIWDSIAGSTTTLDFNLVPGVNAPRPGDLGKSVIAPDAGLLYMYLMGINSLNSPTMITGYDLVNQFIAYNYNKASGGVPVIAGPMSTLTGTTGDINDLFGFMPLSNDRLLILYQFRFASFNRWGVLNFRGNRGDIYAPGQFAPGGYTLTNGTDLLLNYDEEGQLYMTANNRLALVKTTN